MSSSSFTHNVILATVYFTLLHYGQSYTHRTRRNLVSGLCTTSSWSIHQYLQDIFHFHRHICHTSPKKDWGQPYWDSLLTLEIILFLGVLIYKNVWLQPKGEEKTWLWNQKCWIKSQYHSPIVWIWPKSFNNYTFITIKGKYLCYQGWEGSLLFHGWHMETERYLTPFPCFIRESFRLHPT